MCFIPYLNTISMHHIILYLQPPSYQSVVWFNSTTWLYRENVNNPQVNARKFVFNTGTKKCWSLFIGGMFTTVVVSPRNYRDKQSSTLGSLCFVASVTLATSWPPAFPSFWRYPFPYLLAPFNFFHPSRMSAPK